MDQERIAALLEDLKQPDEFTRNRATEALWQLWFTQKGQYGLALIQRSQMLFESGNYQEAEAVLTDLVQDQPDFAEAWNRRAVLYYIQERYSDAIHDCEQVLALNPSHFGALHGLGLCYAAIGEYRDAIRAFHRALEIQPYAITNQRLILECTARLK